MGAKYSYKWCEYFADQASTILEKKVRTFFGVSKKLQVIYIYIYIYTLHRIIKASCLIKAVLKSTGHGMLKSTGHGMLKSTQVANQ